MAKNKAVGNAAEGIAKEFVEKQGKYDIVSTQQTVTTRFGNRRLDMLLRDKKTGELVNAEVKADGSVVRKAQGMKDSDIATNGGVLKGDKAGVLEGRNVRMDRMDLHVNSRSGCVDSCTFRGTTTNYGSGSTGGWSLSSWWKSFTASWRTP